MGNDSQKQQKIEGRHCKHALLDSVQILNQTQQFQLQISVHLPNKSAYQKWLAKISQYHLFSPQNSQLFLLPTSPQFHPSICGQQGSVHFTYKFPPLTLCEQIDHRITINQPFQQKQLWYMLYILIYSSSKIHQRDLIIGDIRPHNIFLFPNGEIVLACMASSYEYLCNYTKSLQKKQPTFLSPQQMVDLEKHKTQNLIPNFCQYFSIGMTLLNMILLHNQQQLYSFSNQQNSLVFNTTQFQKQLILLTNSQNYSSILKSIVLSLLQIKTLNRATSNEILQLLTPYQSQILNLKPFIIKYNNISKTTMRKLAKYNLGDFGNNANPNNNSLLTNSKPNSTQVNNNLSTTKKQRNLISNNKNVQNSIKLTPSHKFQPNVNKNTSQSKQSLLIQNNHYTNNIFSSTTQSQHQIPPNKNNNLNKHTYGTYGTDELTFLASSPDDHRFTSSNTKNQTQKTTLNTNEFGGKILGSPFPYSDTKPNKFTEPKQKGFAVSTYNFKNNNQKSFQKSHQTTLPSLPLNHYQSNGNRLSDMGRQAKSIKYH